MIGIEEKAPRVGRKSGFRLALRYPNGRVSVRWTSTQLTPEEWAREAEVSLLELLEDVRRYDSTRKASEQAFAGK